MQNLSCILEIILEITNRAALIQANGYKKTNHIFYTIQREIKMRQKTLEKL